MNFEEAIEDIKNGKMVKDVMTHYIFKNKDGVLCYSYNLDEDSLFFPVNLKDVNTRYYLRQAEFVEYTEPIRFRSFDKAVEIISKNRNVKFTRKAWENTSLEGNYIFIAEMDGVNVVRIASNGCLKVYYPEVENVIAKDWYAVV